MILSKYAFLIQKEIFHNMGYADLLMLSFVSKNMKKLIKLTQKKRFETISSITYECNGRNLPKVQIANKHGWDIVLDMACHQNWSILMEITKLGKGRYNNFQLNVSGKILDVLIGNKGDHPTLCVLSRDKESVFESIHNYFLDFFGSSVQYYWSVDGYDIPNLQNVSFCIDLRLAWQFREMEKLETFFSSSPVFKWVGLEAFGSSQPFNPESKFYQAESIRIIQLFHTFPAILRYFKGRQAILKCEEWQTSEGLVEFVKRWKSGEAFQKLEYLKFELLHGEVLEEEILDEIEAKYIDAKKQPPMHSLPKVYDWHHVPSNPNTDPIISHAYVVRQSDNRVASVLIQEKTISFGVWNRTEEEFLKLMD
ncbi:hypothetical protein B9Z55_013195 [Caenorhabditis nigoni]|uniref:F-box domain-containing protein n=2 Tax=Caenorhabditis nigoni TaxID=1611254 RepID=A0A2G5U139_9PELO|nr:hypothetical protein B9Z55_013195 [Caenorhabditis nigoni]